MESLKNKNLHLSKDIILDNFNKEQSKRKISMEWQKKCNYIRRRNKIQKLEKLSQLIHKNLSRMELDEKVNEKYFYKKFILPNCDYYLNRNVNHQRIFKKFFEGKTNPYKRNQSNIEDVNLSDDKTDQNSFSLNFNFNFTKKGREKYKFKKRSIQDSKKKIERSKEIERKRSQIEDSNYKRERKSLPIDHKRNNNKSEGNLEREVSHVNKRKKNENKIENEEIQVNNKKDLKKSILQSYCLMNRKLSLSKGSISCVNSCKSKFKPKQISIQSNSLRKCHYKTFNINHLIFKPFNSENLYNDEDEPMLPNIFKLNRLYIEKSSKRHSKDSFDISNITNNF